MLVDKPTAVTLPSLCNKSRRESSRSMRPEKQAGQIFEDPRRVRR
jgi:hypothetical protein